jgi:hypothetical protein
MLHLLDLSHLTLHTSYCSHTHQITFPVSYVSYQNALKTFEVELFKYEMEVGAMNFEILHSATLQWEKENG